MSTNNVNIAYLRNRNKGGGGSANVTVKSSDKSVIINGDYESSGEVFDLNIESHHKITKKNNIVNSEQTRDYLRTFNVQCDISDKTLELFDLSCLTTTTIDPTMNLEYHWNIPADGETHYVGLLGFKGTAYRGIVEVDFERAGGSKNRSEIAFIQDTPIDAAFTFLTNIPFDIVGYFERIRSGSGNLRDMYVVMTIPAQWSGTIRCRFRHAHSDYYNAVFAASELYQKDFVENKRTYYNQDGTQGGLCPLMTSEAMSLLSDATKYDNTTMTFASSVIRAPYGKYYVDGFLDFSKYQVGDNISDWIINDYLLHNIQTDLELFKALQSSQLRIL